MNEFLTEILKCPNCHVFTDGLSFFFPEVGVLSGIVGGIYYFYKKYSRK